MDEFSMENRYSSFSKLHTNNNQESPKLDIEWLKAEADRFIDNRVSALHGTGRYQFCSPTCREDLINDALEILAPHLFARTQHNEHGCNSQNVIAPGPSLSANNPVQDPDDFLAMQERPPGQNINCAPVTFQNGQDYNPYGNVTAIPSPSPHYSTSESNSSADSVPGALQSPPMQSPFHSSYLEPVYGIPRSISAAVKHSRTDSSNVPQSSLLPHYPVNTSQIVQQELHQKILEQELSFKFTSPILSHLNVPIVESLPAQPKAAANQKVTAKTKNGTPHLPKKRGRPRKPAQISNSTTPGTGAQQAVIVNEAVNHAVASQQHDQAYLNYVPQSIPKATEYISMQPPPQARQVTYSNQQVQFPSEQLGLQKSQFVNASTAQARHISGNVGLQEQNGITVPFSSPTNTNFHRPAPPETPVYQLQNNNQYDAGRASTPLPFLQSAGHYNQQMPEGFRMMPQSTPQIIHRRSNMPASTSRQSVARPQPVYQHSSIAMSQQPTVVNKQQQQFQQVPVQQQFVHEQRMMSPPLPIYEHQFSGARPTAQKRRGGTESPGPPPQMARRTATPAPLQHYASTPQIIMNGDSTYKVPNPIQPFMMNGNSFTNQNSIPLPSFGSFAKRY